MMRPYKNHCPATMAVANIKGNGSDSVLRLLKTSPNDARGEAQKMIVVVQHIRPKRNLAISKSISTEMYNIVREIIENTAAICFWNGLFGRA